nr:unnamed protein product [Digitaria exilis]
MVIAGYGGWLWLQEDGPDDSEEAKPDGTAHGRPPRQDPRARSPKRSSASRLSGYGFVNVSGTKPPFMHASFSFLPDRERERLQLVDCCNGLLLCRSYSFADDKEFDYLVLNPATEKWVMVPITR